MEEESSCRRDACSKASSRTITWKAKPQCTLIAERPTKAIGVLMKSTERESIAGLTAIGIGAITIKEREKGSAS